ncbi:MAG: DNA polymerase III subunit delta [Candidatus Omnitrophica bacterium]|nr:DNA polymerase III subunit delta [Candidatus Omnitrophota bacterium]
MPQKTKTPSSPTQTAYLLTGEDEFRKNLSLDKLKTKLLGDKADPFNYCLYYGKTTTAEEVIRSLDTLPLTGAKKLVVLKEPELLSEDDKSVLLNYLKTAQGPKTFLIMLTVSGSSKSEKFSKDASKSARVFDFPKLESNEVTSLVIREFKSHNKRINRQHAELISEESQQDIGRALPLIEQILIFVGKRENVTGEDITQFTQGSLQEASTFKLLDLIDQKDTIGALRILKRLLRTESNPSQIIGLIGWHIARLISIKRMLIKKIPRADMQSYIRTGTYILNRLISQADNFTLNRLRRQLDTLTDIDLLLKRSSIKGEFLLEMLVVKLSA